MTRICLDTSAYSHFKRGAPEALEIICSAREVGFPSIVLGELRAGFLSGMRHEENEQELVTFLQNPVVRILDVDEETTSHYAEIVMMLRRHGTPVPTNDIWIAPSLLAKGSQLSPMTTTLNR
jgi:tRNA(fMet)-specific endonuclease VapC